MLKKRILALFSVIVSQLKGGYFSLRGSPQGCGCGWLICVLKTDSD